MSISTTCDVSTKQGIRRSYSSCKDPILFLKTAGVAASTVGLVVAIVAIVIAVVDLIVVGLTGKGIGDWIMTGLSNFGEYLGNKAWEATQWVEEKRTVGVQIFAYGFEYWDKKFS